MKERLISNEGRKEGIKWNGRGRHRRKKETKAESEKEKMINREDCQRKALLHFRPMCTVRKEVEKQNYSFEDLILEAQ